MALPRLYSTLAARATLGYETRSRMARATTSPEAEACTNPRVMPAPSPAAKRLSTLVSNSGVNRRRDE